MKKLFISQPMRGKTDEEILAVRKKAIESAEKLVGEPVEVSELLTFILSGSTGRRKAFMVPWKVSGIAGNCGRGVFCKRMG